ncbi:MAG: lamin tail domain-containing protein [Reichenbachiella sp.]
MKCIPLIWILILSVPCKAQFVDDFSDGDFIANPVWTGDVTYFIIASEQLNSNGPAETSVLHLSTPCSSLDYTTWTFLIDLKFAPSGSNKVKVYLVSDQSNLESDLNGYFIEIGQSGDDEIKFYRQDQSNSILLFTGSSQLSGNVKVRIQVSRDGSGAWNIAADDSGAFDFESEGSEIVDNTYTNTNYFGVVAIHSSSRAGLFYFDDFSISAEDPPFSVSSFMIDNSNTLKVIFSQPVDVSTGSDVENFSLSNGYNIPSTALVQNSNEVMLTFDADFSNNDYELIIKDVKNQSLLETINESTLSIEIIAPTDFRQIVINEIYSDFNPSATGLPDIEFLELLNVSNQSIKIKSFEINGNPLNKFVLPSGGFVILTDDSDVDMFSGFGDVVGVNSFPSLLNNGLELVFTDNLGNLVDSVSYHLGYYQDELKDDGGYTLEQINPELQCSYISNWAASSSSLGGTPGIINSIYDNSLDETGPDLIQIRAGDENTIIISFDEPMDASTLVLENFNFNNGIQIANVLLQPPGYLSAILETNVPLISGEVYILTISNVTDCSGNLIDKNSMQFRFDNAPPMLERIVVISEERIKLIFDESIEMVSANTASNYSVSNSIGEPSDVSFEDNFHKEISLDFEKSFELGVENYITISNLSDTTNNAMIIPYMATFTYDLGIDTLHVLSPNHIKIHFSESVQNSSAINAENYLLNKNVGSPISVYQSSSDSKIVNLIFQSDIPENKALFLTVQNMLKENGDYLTTPEYSFEYDTAPPKIDTLIALSERTLEVVFTEKVERFSSESRENYEYDDTYPISAQKLGHAKSVLLEFLEVFKKEKVYKLWVKGVKDIYGNAIENRINEKFVFDYFVPTLDSIYPKSPNQLIVIFNEKVTSQSVQLNSNYSLEKLGNPIEVDFDLESMNTVTLTFLNPLPEEQDVTLTIYNIEDQRGNVMKDEVVVSFNNDQLQLGEIEFLDQNSIKVHFTKSVDSIHSRNLSEYILDERHIPISIESDEYTATLLFVEKFEDQKKYNLHVEKIGNLSLGLKEYQFTFQSQLQSALIPNLETIELTFNQNLDVGQSLEKSSFKIDQGIESPDAVVISADNSNILRLIFYGGMMADQDYELTWPQLVNEYGNSIPGYFVTLKFDNLAPIVLDYQILNEYEILLKFNEQLQANSAEFKDNYFIDNGIGIPSSAIYFENDSSVLLEFSSPFIDENSYLLSLTNVKDLVGNLRERVDIDFSYIAPYSAKFGDLIITEIFSKPSEDQSEFFEVYNASSESIEMKSLVFRDGSSQSNFVFGTVEPGEFILFAEDNEDYSNANVGELSKWLTLNNDGEHLTIYNQEQLIFSVSYDGAWYKSEYKNQGGFSLEMVDVNNPCGAHNNWSGSENKGGTPGYINSVVASNPDNTSPFLLTGIAESDRQIILNFNEKLKPVNELIDKIATSPSLVIDKVYQVSPQYKSINVELISSLAIGETYSIEINELSDCAQNWITDNNNSVDVILPEAANFNDIIINEILFNPKPGGVDFVELVNRSEKIIDLQGWYIGDKRNNMRTISNDHYLLNPGEFFVATSDATILATYYPGGDPSRYYEVNSFPSFNDDQDSVLLMNENWVEMDELYYSSDFHFALLNNDEGVSLERISVIAPSNQPDSWRSAASSVGYGTPGKRNSQFVNNTQHEGVVTVDPSVFFPDNTGLDDFTTITYEIGQAGKFANIVVYNITGSIVKTIAENELLSTRGFVTWDGTSDAGELANVGYYVVYFEIFSANGNKDIYKETVVLGTRF